MYREARDADEKERLLGALGYAGAGGQVAETLRLALGPDVRAQDVRLLVLTVAAQSSADAAWDWLRASYEPLRAKLGGGCCRVMQAAGWRWRRALGVSDYFNTITRVWLSCEL